MPLPILIAIILAFGFGERIGYAPIPDREARHRLYALGLGLLLVGLTAWMLGAWLVSRVRRRSRSRSSLRRRLVWGSRGVDLLALGVFGWAIEWLEWPRLVAWNFGLRKLILVDEAVTLLPFLIAQVLGWWGLYGAERSLRPSVSELRIDRYLVLKARQSLGLILPMAIIYGLGRDLLRWVYPGFEDDLRVQLLGLVALGAIILVISPAFIRIAWPSRPLPAGPLRERLERLSRRVRFRYTDLLVWETGGAVVNAGVTGALPWFRYVLISDAMLEQLDPEQIEAVFGHEIGHVAHRHFFSFGLFFLGSLGVGTLIDLAVNLGLGSESWMAGWITNPTALEMTQWSVALSALGLYFFLVFGLLSRGFERQADVFGCRAVSCGQPDCPPHDDPNLSPLTIRPPAAPCPVGIRIFANALAEVAYLNGIARHAHSWRHGSIAHRIDFLQTLIDRPEALGRFRRRLVRLRLTLALVLLSASGLALWLWNVARPLL